MRHHPCASPAERTLAEMASQNLHALDLETRQRLKLKLKQLIGGHKKHDALCAEAIAKIESTPGYHEANLIEYRALNSVLHLGRCVHRGHTRRFFDWQEKPDPKLWQKVSSPP